MNKEKMIEELTKDIGKKQTFGEIYKAIISEKSLQYGVVENRELAEYLTDKGYRKVKHGEWLSAYDYALKLGITDGKQLADAKADKWWKFCPYCEQQVKGFYNYCPNCGAKMKGAE